LILGQVSLPVCALIGTGFWLMLNGHDRTGGILLGLTIIKPNLVFLLVPGLVIWGYARGRRSFWRWMTGTMLVLLALPMPFTPDWILSFIRRLSEYSSYSPFSPPAVLVGRWFPPGVQLGATVGMVALVSAAVLFGWWEAARSEGRGPLSWAFGMSLLGAVWIAPQTSIVNQVILLIPMLGILAILWRQGRPSRLIALSLILVWLVLFWCLVRIPPISTAEPRYPVEHRVLAPILPLTVGFFWVGLRRRLLGLAGGV
jgi:hypothetical protein